MIVLTVLYRPYSLKSIWTGVELKKVAKNKFIFGFGTRKKIMYEKVVYN